MITNRTSRDYAEALTPTTPEKAWPAGCENGRGAEAAIISPSYRLAFIRAATRQRISMSFTFGGWFGKVMSVHRLIRTESPLAS